MPASIPGIVEEVIGFIPSGRGCRVSVPKTGKTVADQSQAIDEFNSVSSWQIGIIGEEHPSV